LLRTGAAFTRRGSSATKEGRAFGCPDAFVECARQKVPGHREGEFRLHLLGLLRLIICLLLADRVVYAACCFERKRP
jgi:hypothetical protein